MQFLCPTNSLPRVCPCPPIEPYQRDRNRAKSLTIGASLLKCQEGFTIQMDFAGTLAMKNVYEVLRQKEMELTRLEKEVEALRLVAPLLSEEGKENGAEIGKPTLAPAVNASQAPRIAVPSTPIPAPQPVRASGWDDTAKRWP